MRTRLSLLTSLLVSLLSCLAIGCGPTFVLPGGRLTGEVLSVPSDWSFTEETTTVQLETRPGDPYSVNIWGTAAAGSFYVAGRSGSTWVENATADPRVRLRVGSKVYELEAVPVETDAELESVIAAMKRKYDYEIEPEDRAAARAFRLEARTAG